MPRYRPWTDAELDFLKTNVTILTDIQIAAALTQVTGKPFTYNIVGKMRRRLRLPKSRGKGRWFVPKTL